MSNYPVGQQLLLLGLVLVLLFGSYVVPQVAARLFTSDHAPTTSHYTEPPPEVAHTRNAVEPINATINAEAALVWDVTNQRVLYEKNADTTLPLASITKLMTALLAYELVPDEETISITLPAVAQPGNSGLRDGEQFELSTLRDMTLISSSNDGAYAIASSIGSQLDANDGAAAFIAGMNLRAEELGLQDTHFKNPTGLDESAAEAGAVGSARDVTKLMEYILLHHPEILAATTHVSDRYYNQSGQYHETENTNALVDQIPGLIGSKTGYTDLAGGNLTVAYNDGLNRPIIVTVLGSSWRGRFADVTTLVNAVH